jgi:hypothetical protein
MRQHLLWVLPLIIAILSGCVAPAADINVALGEKSSLAIGQSASITGEELKVKFIKVIGDSRCPQGVQCIWAGEASSLIEITYSGSTYQKVLTQPGASEPAQTDFSIYEITFDLQPYPKAGEEITDKAYRLEFQVDKKTS